MLSEITRRVRQLPEPLQAEVLRFADYLLARAAATADREESAEWSGLSLQSAMRGIESEDTPDYTEADLTERFA